MSTLDQQTVEKQLHDLRQIGEQLKESGLSSDKIHSLEENQKALNDYFDKQETKNQELLAELDKQKKEKETAFERLDQLEKQISRFGTANPDYQVQSEGIKALVNFLGTGSINSVTKSYMRTDSNVNAGYLMRKPDVNNFIIKPITEMTRLRQPGGARVRRVSSLKAESIVREFLVQAYWTKEGAPNITSNSTYGAVNSYVHSQTAQVLYSQQAVLDADFDLENEIRADIVERFGQLEGAAFVNGTGVNEPQGFMVPQSNIPRYNSGIANSFDMDSLARLTGELKTGYSPRFGMNRKTIAYLRTLKGNDNYFWEPNVQAGVPNLLLGVPYMEIPDMAGWDGTTPDAENIIYADFNRMYEILDAYQAIVQVDPYTQGDSNQTVMRMHRFVGGNVVLPEAGVILKNAV